LRLVLQSDNDADLRMKFGSLYSVQLVQLMQMHGFQILLVIAWHQNELKMKIVG